MSKLIKRRQFIKGLARFSLGFTLAGLLGFSMRKAGGHHWVWQIDPFKCTSCGRCATGCVLNPSAVKAVHGYDLCGFCDLCGGYYKPGHIARNTAAENTLCPTDAIKRTFVEEPYFEYKVKEELCIGCAKCVEGCTAFGNGALHLQINHDICTNCNECANTRVSPSDAIKRVPAKKAYNIKGEFV